MILLKNNLLKNNLITLMKLLKNNLVTLMKLLKNIELLYKKKSFYNVIYYNIKIEFKIT